MTKINENIFRLTIPYKDIYTTVYLIKTPEGSVLFDAASTDEDTENYIIPFLKEIGVYENVKYVFVSHKHGDHVGGLKRLVSEIPDICIISRSPVLKEEYKEYKFIFPNDNHGVSDVLRVITIPGHTEDSCGLFDTRTNTLITGDSLQFYGIYGSGDWACNIRLPIEHMEALDKLKGINIDTVYMAHEYHPCGYVLCGNDNINSTLDLCIEPLRFIRDIILENPHKTDEEIRSIFNSEDLPTVNLSVVTALRKVIDEGRFI